MTASMPPDRTRPDEQARPDAQTVARAVAILQQAGQTAMGYFRAPIGVDFKSDDSPVTIADRSVEAEIRAALGQDFPGDAILGEEQAFHPGTSSRLWVIDPIDGTRSFISGLPLFGMLLGLMQDDLPRLGVVNMPALGETFTGVPGRGATLNGREIHASTCTDLARATLYINEGDKIFAAHPDVFARLVVSGRTHRFSYDCYPHALLAAGHVDVVVDYDLKPYDYLAPAALISAAGGVMSDWSGRALDLESDGRVLSAATPELHAAMLDLLAAKPG